jgi:hypothetical protein
MNNFKALVATVLLLSLNPAIAKVLSLHCPGTNQGNDIQTSYEPVDIQVQVSTGEIFGFPLYKAPGCGDVFGNLKVESKVTENQYQTDCENNHASSIIRLNRYSGALTITTVFKNKNETWWDGRYMCSQQKRKF